VTTADDPYRPGLVGQARFLPINHVLADSVIAVATDDPAAAAWEAGYSAALDTAERLLGFRLERFLGTAPSEPANGADFKRIATMHAFGDVWPREEYLDLKTRALTSVAIVAALGIKEPLRGQLRIAINVGATKEAIAEVFLQVAVYAGVARAFDGYQVAIEVFAESTEP
jgi:4-carboxymuconolactone decarboxylase